LSSPIWTMILIIGIIDMYYHAQLFQLRWDLINYFALDWPRTVILPISTSWAPRIIGMRHQHLVCI
jgi:hypothetical protein